MEKVDLGTVDYTCIQSNKKKCLPIWVGPKNAFGSIISPIIADLDLVQHWTISDEFTKFLVPQIMIWNILFQAL